jgi:hypothetical protein
MSKLMKVYHEAIPSGYRESVPVALPIARSSERLVP